MKIKLKEVKGKPLSITITAEGDREGADLKDVVLAVAKRPSFAAVLEELGKKGYRDKPRRTPSHGAKTATITLTRGESGAA